MLFKIYFYYITKKIYCKLIFAVDKIVLPCYIICEVKMDNKYIELIRQKAILNMTTAKEWESKIKLFVEKFIYGTNKDISVYDVDILSSGISVYLSRQNIEKKRFDKSRIKFLDFDCKQCKNFEFFSQSEIEILNAKWRAFLSGLFNEYQEDCAAHLAQTVIAN